MLTWDAQSGLLHIAPLEHKYEDKEEVVDGDIVTWNVARNISWLFEDKHTVRDEIDR
jgi:hypothetical protein